MSAVEAARWEGAGADDLARRWGLPAVHLFEAVGSTNDVARALAATGAPHGTLVLADAQTAGRGRGGRGWASSPGVGVWMTLVVRPERLPSPGLLPILVGIAAAAALDPFARPLATAIKWPNDLHLAGRKVAGILCEGAWDGAGEGAAVAGIGVNVLHTLEDFPPEVRETATSLRIAAGWSPSRVEVAGALAAALARILAQPPEQLSGAMLAALHARDALQGERVQVTGAQPLTGRAMGITPAGALLVRTAAGVLRTVHAGTVRVMNGSAPDPGSPSADT